MQVAEEESSFSVVDNTRTSTKPRGGFGRGGGTVFRGRGQRGGPQRGGDRGGRGGGGFDRGGGDRGGRGGRDNRGGFGRGGRGRRFGWRDWDKPQRNRDSSVTIRPDWQLREEIDFGRIAKLSLAMPDAQDLDNYGFLYYYDRSYDKAPSKATERKLQSLERAAYNVTTTSDPVIQELADNNEATVFATADILSMLMCAPRSVYSWDIVITQHGDKIFFDKRENSSIDLVTVNENALDAPMEVTESGGAAGGGSGAGGKQPTAAETLNSPGALAVEASIINHNFALQTVVESANSKVDFAHDNPFYSASEETEPLASKGFRYRRFGLSLEHDAEPVNIVVRTELDAVMKSTTGEDQTVTLKALNEFDSKAQGSGAAPDWRTKLTAQRGAVLASELKNNNVKLARWTTQAILARADVMKLGFVSRVNPKQTSAGHVVLGVLGYKPREFATQMNLNLANGWGIVRTIVDLVQTMSKKQDDEKAAAAEEEGGGDDEGEGAGAEAGEDAGPEKTKKFVLVKDPNKSVLRLYSVPLDTFEEGDEAAAAAAPTGPAETTAEE